ncbi:hypothetical protein SCHPADRAFT_315077 [Schizopora paradoxa]|uniref:Uncharacterized protein n=1 Tax=Schizopora paradoxa TaxID=27342 RepID=A0A0H2RQW2_9AGAM|nr:hypothetical protein SCHPADRAFT_315077 [Schizopora paradoxa]
MIGRTPPGQSMTSPQTQARRICWVIATFILLTCYSSQTAKGNEERALKSKIIAHCFQVNLFELFSVLKNPRCLPRSHCFESLNRPCGGKYYQSRIPDRGIDHSKLFNQNRPRDALKTIFLSSVII